jgi:hypothetical protein
MLEKILGELIAHRVKEIVVGYSRSIVFENETVINISNEIFIENNRHFDELVGKALSSFVLEDPFITLQFDDIRFKFDAVTPDGASPETAVIHTRDGIVMVLP